MKTALLIGAGSGIGADAARKLADEGYNISIMSSSGKGESLAKELKGIGFTGSNLNNKPTRAEINDIATAIFQGADVVMLSAETSIGKYPLEAVLEMKKTIISSEKYKREHVISFKSKTKIFHDPVKAIALAIKDIAYNIKINAIIAFSVSGNTAQLVSATRPSTKIITISPSLNISRRLSLLWGITSINNGDAKNWKEMMGISKKIIINKKLNDDNGYVIITAGLPFGKSKMTNMIRLYQVK